MSHLIIHMSEELMGQYVEQKMRALFFQKTGSLSNLQVGERPVPVPVESEALVQIKAAAINPSDAKNVMGKFLSTTLPRIPGRDFSGIVLKGPSTLVGREVFGAGGNLGFGRDGSHAEMLAVPAETLALKPSSFSYAQAAALGVAFLTAWQSVMNAGKLQSGETILIIGASGQVGSTAAQLAKAKGARVLGTLSKASGLSRVSHLPVDSWIALDEKRLPDTVLELTGGKGAAMIFDTVGGPMFEEGLKSLAHRGRQVAISSLGDPRVSLNLVDFYHKESVLMGVDSLKLSFAESGEILRQWVPLMEAGKITPPRTETVSLDQAAAAYEKVLNGTTRDKQVIIF
jgi:NADPH2:quinone reductase